MNTLDIDAGEYVTHHTCTECGQPYSVDSGIRHQYFDSPYYYDRGYATCCLACWLGVGPKDLEREALEP